VEGEIKKNEMQLKPKEKEKEWDTKCTDEPEMSCCCLNQK
jgi:hypothetical protein